MWVPIILLRTHLSTMVQAGGFDSEVLKKEKKNTQKKQQQA